MTPDLRLEPRVFQRCRLWIRCFTGIEDMQVLRNKAFSLAALGLFTGFSASAVQGCGGDGICGPCGSVLEGSVSIVNNARVDGFFRAIADLNGVFVRVNADFEGNIRALAEVWGFIEAGAEAEIKAKFGTDPM